MAALTSRLSLTGGVEPERFQQSRRNDSRHLQAAVAGSCAARSGFAKPPDSLNFPLRKQAARMQMDMKRSPRPSRHRRCDGSPRGRGDRRSPDRLRSPIPSQAPASSVPLVVAPPPKSTTPQPVVARITFGRDHVGVIAVSPRGNLGRPRLRAVQVGPQTRPRGGHGRRHHPPAWTGLWSEGTRGLDQRGRMAPGHDVGNRTNKGRIATSPGPWLSTGARRAIDRGPRYLA